jgi:hypothetical protein
VQAHAISCFLAVWIELERPLTFLPRLGSAVQEVKVAADYCVQASIIRPKGERLPVRRDRLLVPSKVSKHVA